MPFRMPFLPKTIIYIDKVTIDVFVQRHWFRITIIHAVYHRAAAPNPPMGITSSVTKESTFLTDVYYTFRHVAAPWSNPRWKGVLEQKSVNNLHSLWFTNCQICVVLVVPKKVYRVKAPSCSIIRLCNVYFVRKQTRIDHIAPSRGQYRRSWSLTRGHIENCY